MRRRMIRSDVDWVSAWEQIREDAGQACSSLGSLLLLLAFVPVACVIWLWVPERSAERTAWEAEQRMRRFEDI